MCVVGTAPLQRHPTVPIFAAGSGFESRKSRLALDHALDPTLQVLLKTTEKTGGRHSRFALLCGLCSNAAHGVQIPAIWLLNHIAQAFVVLWTLQTDPQLHYTPRSVSSSLSLSLSFCATRPRWGTVEVLEVAVLDRYIALLWAASRSSSFCIV